MSNIRITKQFSFETGHALYGYDGKCKNVHGHSYKLSVTVIGKPITDTANVKWHGDRFWRPEENCKGTNCRRV
jgi:6-pyruvoyltetrahydropterin/6-carboxytetrahydropterin synthase